MVTPATSISNSLGTLELIAVNVALPEVIGTQRGKPVLSAIRKQRVTDRSVITLSRENLEGDRQADLRVHGGPDKAVYVYPVEHLPHWNADLAPATPFGPGTFGENLSISGVTEHDARIGDIWAWGETRLQICQPRYPCFKLAIATSAPIVGKRMLETLRNGWYLRVLEPGEAPIAGPIQILEHGPSHATVANAVRALLPGAPRTLTESIAAVPQLSPNWRKSLLDVLGSDAE